MRSKARTGVAARDMFVDGMPDKPVAIRLPEDLIAKIDQFLERMNRANPGLNPTRGDAIRVLLTKALLAEEEAAKSRRK